MGGQRTDRPKTRNGETSPFTCKEARPANGHPPPANFRGELASTFFVLCERSETARAQQEGKGEGRERRDRGRARATASARLGPSSEPQAPCSFPPPLSPSVPTLALASLWRRARAEANLYWLSHPPPWPCPRLATGNVATSEVSAADADVTALGSFLDWTGLLPDEFQRRSNLAFMVRRQRPGAVSSAFRSVWARFAVGSGLDMASEGGRRGRSDTLLAAA